MQITLENYKQCFLIMCWFRNSFGLEMFRFILILTNNAIDIYNSSMFPKLDIGHNNGFWNNFLIVKFTRCDNRIERALKVIQDCIISLYTTTKVSLSYVFIF